MIAGAVGFLRPVIALWIWTDALSRAAFSRPRAVLAALAFAGGVGASSITTMWLVLNGVPIGRLFVIIDVVLWGTLAAIGGWRLRASRRARRDPSQRSSRENSSRAPWPIRLVFVVVAGMAAATAVQEYLVSPHGEWDAWAVWNQKARFLVRGGERWTDELAILWSNPSHPLLIPLTVARIWAYAGSEATVVPAALAASFGAGCVAIVMGALGLHRVRAWIAGAVLVAPGAFLQQAMTQQADVPVAFFMVTAVVMLLKADAALATEPHAARGCLVLAGLLTGCAAWTKNEGLLFAGAMAPALLWITRRGAPRQLLWWLLGAALPVLTLVWFKANVAPVPPPYFEETQVPFAILAQVAGSDRGLSILRVMAQETLVWGGRSAAGVAILMLAASMAAAIRSTHAAIVLSVIAFMLFGYFGVFLVTPLDAAWLVGMTFYRLLAQLWPLLVLAAFSFGERPRVRTVST
jgi:hypothetical protein